MGEPKGATATCIMVVDVTSGVENGEETGGYAQNRGS